MVEMKHCSLLWFDSLRRSEAVLEFCNVSSVFHFIESEQSLAFISSRFS